MPESVPLFTVVLGLLSYLAVASKPGDVDVNRLPIFFSLDQAFTLRGERGWNVILRPSENAGEQSFAISQDETKLPYFTLNNGTLTTADQKLAALFGSDSTSWPPPLNPILFGEFVWG